MGPARDGLTQERLNSLCFSGRQFANNLVNCVNLIGGSTETTMMILVFLRLLLRFEGEDDSVVLNFPPFCFSSLLPSFGSFFTVLAPQSNLVDLLYWHNIKTIYGLPLYMFCDLPQHINLQNLICNGFPCQSIGLLISACTNVCFTLQLCEILMRLDLVNTVHELGPVLTPKGF